jgi:brefeldin A-inhibited guanine nucleotide-exchange protein
MQCFHKSYTFARTFNQDKDLRAHIWKSGFVKQMPNLFKQEMVALTAYLRLAFSLYRTYGDASMSAHDLVGELRHLFVAYNDMLGDPGKHQRELANWTVTVVMAWEEVLTVPWTKVGEVKVVGFKRHLPELFQLAVSMLSSESKEVRTVLQEFLKQVGECFLNISG